MSDIRAIYERIGADFDDVAGRLGSPALVERFAGKFVQDDSFSQLEDALAAHDAKAAFRAAHTLKGVALNLGLSNLAAPLSSSLRLYAPVLSKKSTSSRSWRRCARSTTRRSKPWGSRRAAAGSPQGAIVDSVRNNIHFTC